MSANDYDLQLEELELRSTFRLLSSGSFDAAAFAELRAHVCQKAEALRGEYVLSKQLLKALRGASSAIRNQSAHVAEARAHLSVADDFEMLLDLLIAGEGCEDRTPGSPRIL
jgi:hypothetical protein